MNYNSFEENKRPSCNCGGNSSDTKYVVKFIQETTCYYPEDWKDNDYDNKEKDYDNKEKCEKEEKKDRCDWPREEKDNDNGWKDRDYDWKGHGKKEDCYEEKQQCHGKHDDKHDNGNRCCNRCCFCNLFRNWRRW